MSWPIFSPLIGAISSFCCLASLRKSGSFIVAMNAACKALALSAGKPGGATNGRPHA